MFRFYLLTIFVSELALPTWHCSTDLGEIGAAAANSGVAAANSGVNVSGVTPPIVSMEARAKLLRARYGHVAADARNPLENQYLLHLKVDDRVVNQGLCFFNEELKTYYLKSRKFSPDAVPKETILMDLEMPKAKKIYTHVEFYLSGMGTIELQSNN